jgi:tRNA dimethylallyltransferase
MDIGTNKERPTVPQHLVDILNPGERLTVADFQQQAYTVIDAVSARGALPILVGGSMLYAEAIMRGYQFAGELKQKSSRQEPRYRVLSLAPEADRNLLKERLQQRTRDWVEAGLVEEIKGLLAQGVSADWLKSCGLEYRFFTQYVLGEIALDEAIRLTIISLNQYVKRQYTWWRRHPDLHWVKSVSEAERLVREFRAVV